MWTSNNSECRLRTSNTQRNLVRLRTAKQRSVERNVYMINEKIRTALKMYSTLITTTLATGRVTKMVKITHIVLSAKGKENRYALVDVVNLRMYTTCTARFPGTPIINKYYYYHVC